MEKFEVIILVSAIAVAATRLYQKYIKKKNSHGSGSATNPRSSFPSNKGDDDYEPYSK